MKITHAQAQDLLQQRLEAPLPLDRQSALEEHLSECPKCTAFQASLTGLDRLLSRSLAKRWPARRFSQAEIQLRLAEVQSVHRRNQLFDRASHFSRQLFSAAALGLLVIGLVWVLTTLRPQPVALNPQAQSTGSPTPAPSLSPSANLAGTQTPSGEALLSPTPPASGNQTYPFPDFHLSLTLPTGWQIVQPDEAEGPDGSLRLAKLPGTGRSLQQVCEKEANGNPLVYGDQPQITMTAFGEQEGCLILTSLSQNITGRTGILVRYPGDLEPDSYLLMQVSASQLEPIASSLRFLIGEDAASTGPQAPFSTPDPNQPIPTPGMNSLVFGKLLLEEWVIVPVEVDSPLHFEFNERIPENIWARRREAREIPPEEALKEVNQWLAHFGYWLESKNSEGGGASSYTLYRDNQSIKDNISMFYPISVSGSGKDFALVVEETGGYSLIRNGSIEDWDPGLHGFTVPVFAGDSLVSVEYTGDTGQVRVRKGEEVVYHYSVAAPWVDNPLKGLAAWEGKWVLEVNGVVIVDGQSLNEQLGCDEIFNWQLLDGKPFFFFQKDGKIHLSYDGQMLPYRPYDEVIHYRCCEPAAFNARGNPHMVWFYAKADGWWHYVEVGNWW